MTQRTSVLLRLFHDLYRHFGPQHWWPADSPWEVAVGAVLTQNTNWRNVEKAIGNLKAANALGVESILALPESELSRLIQPSGFFNVKTRRLRCVAAWWLQRSKHASDPNNSLRDVRDDLLAVHGVGEETADSILLYACDRVTFVVDAYTKTFLKRHQLIAPEATYAEVKALFESDLPPDLQLYREYHALIVALGKSSCRRQPRCENCPARWHLLL